MSAVTASAGAGADAGLGGVCRAGDATGFGSGSAATAGLARPPGFPAGVFCLAAAFFLGRDAEVLAADRAFVCNAPVFLALFFRPATARILGRVPVSAPGRRSWRAARTGICTYHAPAMSTVRAQPLRARARFARAARGEPVDRAPVWLMRQAGRYLPEYRELRARVDFLALCRDPALACEVSLQPFRRFGMDGVVVFSDILLPLAGTGLGLSFDPGPRVAHPAGPDTGLRHLTSDPSAAVEPTCEAIRRLRAELGDAAAVIGFAGAPWTLAAYACEARLTRDLQVLGALTFAEPGFVDDLLERMAQVCAASLRLQIDAGADALQIFDTWAGVLPVSRFERFAGRALRRVLALLPAERPPLILFARGAAHLVEALAAIGADVVSLDWRVDLADAAARIGRRVSLQGNLEPHALAAPTDEIERAVADLLDAGRKARGHIANLGHGVLPSTPVEGVAAFVRAVQRS
jgi:uroporphyrinogen decarboxylase